MEVWIPILTFSTPYRGKIWHTVHLMWGAYECTYGPKTKIAQTLHSTIMLSSVSNNSLSLVQWRRYCSRVEIPVTKLLSLMKEVEIRLFPVFPQPNYIVISWTLIGQTLSHSVFVKTPSLDRLASKAKSFYLPIK